MISGEIFPMLKEALLEMTWRWSPACIWVFVTEIMDEFILGLDILPAGYYQTRPDQVGES
jgi:hypothetical protein